MPDRVAYVYSVKEPPGATRPSQYCTYLRHMMVDSNPITVQVKGGVGGLSLFEMCAQRMRLCLTSCMVKCAASLCNPPSIAAPLLI